MAELPPEIQPATLAAEFPRIANALAAFWTMPDECMSYLLDLLVDKRGGRCGFPVRASAELHALRAHYAELHRDRLLTAKP